MSKLLHIGICDDQKECVENLRAILCDYLEKRQMQVDITLFASTEELLKSDWQKLQILFLDVVMGQQDGIQAAAQIRRRNPDISLIFVSAFLDYATMGYQVKASAYLLKSNLAATFSTAMDAVLTERQLAQDTIEISVAGCTIPLQTHSIRYIESNGRVSIFHEKVEYSTYMRFSDVEELLCGKGFLRIHRCYIVNLANCVTFKNYQAILDTGEKLPCSRQEYRNLMQSLIRWKGIHQ